jgi:rSAM/selenodomain-associated transferase 1
MRTLAVFAKEPKPGRVKTRLAAAIGAEAACLLYQAFVRDLARTLASARDLRVEWWVDGDAKVVAGEIDLAIQGRNAPAMEYFRQSDRDLGERMGLAFDDAFARQRPPVALIGTDCPLIGLRHIENLFAAVETGADAALIPVDDGGYVGLALARPAPEAFAGIPWSTPAVLETTVGALRGAGRTVQVLAPLYDVDTPEDLARLARDLRADPARATETARVVRELSRAPDVA